VYLMLSKVQSSFQTSKSVAKASVKDGGRKYSVRKRPVGG